jgi:hypothetical protein
MNMENLTDIQLLALSKVVTAAVARRVNTTSTLPELASATVDFSVEIQGTIARGANEVRKGTNRALSRGAVIALLAKSGCVREANAAAVVNLWKEIGTLDKEGFERWTQAQEAPILLAMQRASDLFDLTIIDKLPKIPCKGKVKFA